MSPRVGGTFPDGKKAGEAMERQAGLILRELDMEMRTAIVDDLLPLLTAASPVATELWKSSRATRIGELRAAWKSIPGSPTPGEDTVIFNAAPHAAIIESGRHMVTHRRGKRAGVRRMIGSPFAPRGMVKPSIKTLEGSEESATAKVVAEVERRLG